MTPQQVEARHLELRKANSDLRERLDDLPETMRNAQRWMLWRLHPHKNPGHKPRKVPLYANGSKRSGKLDSKADRQQLTSLDTALAALTEGDYTGLGFALGPDGTGQHWQGIDLDELSKRPELLGLAENLPGYTETSPSGDGMHAIGYGAAFDSLGSNGSGVEAYSAGRYFTVTGENMGTAPPECLAGFIETECKPAHARKAISSSSERTQPQDADGIPILPPTPEQVADLRSALNHLRADARELWASDIGMALKTAGDIGRGLWMDWSSTSVKHDPLADSDTWDSFKPRHTHWKHVFTAAQKAGWVNPKASHGPGDRSSLQPTMPFCLVPVRELINNTKPPQWLIKDMLEADTLGQLFGQSGAGKSFVAIDWACCVATGETWQGRDVQQGSVIYLAGEGHGGLGRRFKAWSLHRGVSLDDAPLFASKTAAALMDEASAQAVMDAVDQIATEHEPPALVVVDTLARNLGPGDENSNADVGKFINALDRMRLRFGASVLIVHHTGHTEQNRARGASSLRAAVDHEYQAEARAGSLVKLTAHKMKEGELPAPLWLEMQQVAVGEDDDGMPVNSAVLVPGVEFAKPDKELTASQQAALENFIEAAREHGVLSKQGKFEGLHLEKWRPVFYASSAADTTESKKKQFQRAREALVERGELTVQEDVYQLSGLLCQTDAEEIEDAIRARESREETRGDGTSGTPGQERDTAGTLSRKNPISRDGTGHTPKGVSHVPLGSEEKPSPTGTSNASANAHLQNSKEAVE